MQSKNGLGHVSRTRTSYAPNVVDYQLSQSELFMVVIEGIDPSSSAYETATHPSTSYHHIEEHYWRDKIGAISFKGRYY